MSEVKTNREYFKYVENNVVDDKDTLYQIADITNKELKRVLDLKIEPVEMMIAIVMETFRVFKKKLQEKAASGYSRYKINVAGKFEIGYDNALNDDYEKNGGFTYYIKHLYQEVKSDDYSREYEDNSITLCAAWNSVNIKTDSKFINEVLTELLPALKKLEIKVENQELIMPVVCIFYDCMVNYMKIQRESLKEFELQVNIASIFDIRVMESDDGEDIVTLTPAIEYKLGLKDDAGSSSQYDFED